MAESIGTAAIATDMLQIARAFGQEKVNYWGISYGTTIGFVFINCGSSIFTPPRLWG